MGWINDGGNHLRYALLICSPVIRTVIKAVSRYGVMAVVEVVVEVGGAV